MKYFVVADVHGFYTKLNKALKEAGFDRNNPDHCFVSCGDLLDRGHQPDKCLEFVTNLDPARRILIRGNHEDLMEQAINRMSFMGYDITNGTVATARALTGTRNDIDALIGMRTHKLYNAYIQECVDFAETEHYIFVHGWIPCWANKKMSGMTYLPIEGDWRQVSKRVWEDARWTNGMDAWSFGIREPGKTIMCGHWHASWGHHYLHSDGYEFDGAYHKGIAKFTPFVDEGIVALDACTAYSGFVNCVVVED